MTPTIDCRTCKEEADIDALKCPHCRSVQITNKGMVAFDTLVGILLLPISYFAGSVALSYGIPSGFAEGVGAGIVWAIVLVGPILLVIGVGGYLQRKEAVQESTS